MFSVTSLDKRQKFHNHNSIQSKVRYVFFENKV